jgi:predicted RNA-binding protein Jag
MSIIVEAPTIKKAIKIALEKLGATKGRVVIEILREEKNGLFGMEGARFAKIKVSFKK